MSRLSTEFWVSAYRQHLEAKGIAVMITNRGDKIAGALLIKLCTMDGQAIVFQRQTDLINGGFDWVTLTEGDERECDASLAKQLSFDPDLWIIEVEDRKGRHCLDEPGFGG